MHFYKIKYRLKLTSVSDQSNKPILILKNILAISGLPLEHPSKLSSIYISTEKTYFLIFGGQYMVSFYTTPKQQDHQESSTQLKLDGGGGCHL